MKNVRYPAYPLIACDPFFSVWSMCDRLNGDNTRHWTGALQPMTGVLTIDGKSKIFMGRLLHNPNSNPCDADIMEQSEVEVTPLKTVYTFKDDSVRLKVTFMTPPCFLHII